MNKRLNGTRTGRKQPEDTHLPDTHWRWNQDAERHWTIWADKQHHLTSSPLQEQPPSLHLWNEDSGSAVAGPRLTGVTPHVDLEAAGLVVGFVAARVAAAEVARLSEVGAVVGEQGAEGDEGFLTAWRRQTKDHVGRWHKKHNAEVNDRNIFTRIVTIHQSTSIYSLTLVGRMCLHRHILTSIFVLP